MPESTAILEMARPETEPLTSSPKQVVMPKHGLIVFESRHAPGFYGELRDNYSKFGLVITGRARWEAGGRDYAAGPNMLFHIPAKVPHRQRDLPDNPVTVYFIHYRTGLLEKSLAGQLAAFGLLGLDLTSPKFNQASQARSLFREMLFEQDAGQVGWQVLLLARLVDLAVRTLRMAKREADAKPPQFAAGADSAERVAYYALTLHTRFYRQETLADAANSLNLSRRRFTELFRRATGQSWCKFVQALRLKHAADLLATTDKSVIAVAFESGFEDLSHFHHSFKTAHGYSPLAFRKLQSRPAR